MKTNEPATKTQPRTAKQKEVSRRNGSKSNGPVTKAGKLKSSRNAVKHGLFSQVLSESQTPVFADPDEYMQIVARIISEFGISTEMGRSFAGTLAMDMLRLRHVRAMELTIINPRIDQDRDVENALRWKQDALRFKPIEEVRQLVDAYNKIESDLLNGQRIRVSDDAVDLVAADLWSTMNAGRKCVDECRANLREVDAMIAADPENKHLAERRKDELQGIEGWQDFMRVTDRDVFKVGSEADIKTVITGGKRLTPKQREKWNILIGICQSEQQSTLIKVRQADEQIDACRREHIGASVEKLDKLHQLGEYEAQIRRAITKNLALIKEFEKMAVIDVLE